MGATHWDLGACIDSLSLTRKLGLVHSFMPLIHRPERIEGAPREREVAGGDVGLARIDADQRAAVSARDLLAGDPDRRHGPAGAELDDDQARPVERAEPGVQPAVL